MSLAGEMTIPNEEASANCTNDGNPLGLRGSRSAP